MSLLSGRDAGGHGDVIANGRGGKKKLRRRKKSGQHDRGSAPATMHGSKNTESAGGGERADGGAREGAGADGMQRSEREAHGLRVLKRHQYVTQVQLHVERAANPKPQAPNPKTTLDPKP